MKDIIHIGVALALGGAGCFAMAQPASSDPPARSASQAPRPTAAQAPGRGGRNPSGELTRGEVKAELARARRDGEIPEGDSTETPAHRNPKQYRAQRLKDGQTPEVKQ